MADIVLVPGAYHGGWYFSPILAQLRAAGHRVNTITLAGLDARSAQKSVAINLDRHIEDVVTLIEDERLTDVILCGHSYGGMVIAGAASVLGGRVSHLLFVDALVPDDGDSVWSFWPKESRDRFIDSCDDGLNSVPPPGLDARARPHPLGTFIQPIRLSAGTYRHASKCYALCTENFDSPFHVLCDRLEARGDWEIAKLACGHDIMQEAPQSLAELILQAAVA